MPSQFFDIMLSTNVSCHHRNFKKFRLEIREKFHFEIWVNFDHSKIFNRLVPKLVLRHALSGNIHLVQFGSSRENFVLDFCGISL